MANENKGITLAQIRSGAKEFVLDNSTVSDDIEYSDLLQGTVYQLTVKNHQLMDTNCHSQAINSANVQSIDVAPTHVATPTELSTLNDG